MCVCMYVMEDANHSSDVPGQPWVKAGWSITLKSHWETSAYFITSDLLLEYVAFMEGVPLELFCGVHVCFIVETDF